MGVRAQNGLPGGVLGNGDHRSRFREKAGILLPTEGHFGLLRLNLSMTFNIKSIKIDINLSHVMSSMMF